MTDETQKVSRIKFGSVALPILAMCSAGVIFYYGAPVFIPLSIAALTAYTLTPVVEFLKKLKIPHLAAVLIVIMVLLAIGVLLLTIIISELIDLAAELPNYQATIQEQIDSLRVYLDREFSHFGGSATILKGFRIDQIDFAAIIKVVFKGAGSIGSISLSAFLLLFLTFFILADYRLYLDKIALLFGQKNKQAQLEILWNINRQLRGFILVKLGVTMGMTIIVTIILILFKIPYSYIWGPLAGILNLIPYIGPVLGAVPPLIVAAITKGSLGTVLALGIVFLAIQIVESNFITPKLTAGKVDLNPLAVMISSVIWGYLWGGVGVVLAVPITAAIKVFCDNTESLEPIGILLGNRTKSIE